MTALQYPRLKRMVGRSDPEFTNVAVIQKREEEE